MFILSLASDESTPDVADVSDTGGKDECYSTGKGKKREMDEATYLTSKRPSTSTYSKRTSADSVEKINEKHGASVPKVIGHISVPVSQCTHAPSAEKENVTFVSAVSMAYLHHDTFPDMFCRNFVASEW